jgi:hypothetical protein
MIHKIMDDSLECRFGRCVAAILTAGRPPRAGSLHHATNAAAMGALARQFT